MAMPRNDWNDAVSDALGIEHTDEPGWRFAPHGWVATRARLGPAFERLKSERDVP
jgi:hypothetical protein